MVRLALLLLLLLLLLVRLVRLRPRGRGMDWLDPLAAKVRENGGGWVCTAWCG